MRRAKARFGDANASVNGPPMTPDHLDGKRPAPAHGVNDGCSVERRARVMDASGTTCPALCVDMDRTLVTTDTLIESLTRLLRRNPALIFVLPWWLLRGRAHLKEQVALRAGLDAALLPYNPEVLGFLREEQLRGRRIVLATASDRRIAAAVAAHLRFFSDVFASDGKANLKGSAKADALVRRYGARGYVYVGDGWADLPVWRNSAGAVVVGGSPELLARIAQTTPVIRCLGTTAPGVASTLLRLARPHHWVKNLLLLVPLATAHRVGDATAWTASVLGIIAACLASSAVYAVNDVADLPADRAHPVKRARPLASGHLQPRIALLFAGTLAGVALLVGARLPAAFVPSLLVYLAGATVYSLWLKRVAYADVAALASLYVLRVQMGAAAIAVPVSHWLLGFTALLFLGLALLKRYIELDEAARSGRDLRPWRGYPPGHATAVARLGFASGVGAVAILAFYVCSREASLYYARPDLLWGLVPLVALWLVRAWRIALRNGMDDDPVAFAVRDTPTYAVLMAIGTLMLFAT
jgi:4-hydroxybenzoate polyprenyltransferase/phosphoserine phosphatase